MRKISLMSEYETFRGVCRITMLYGCYTKEEYLERLKVSPRTFDDNKARLKDYLPESVLKTKKKGRKEISYFVSDSYKQLDDVLFEMFRSKVFRELDIVSLIEIPQILLMIKEASPPEILKNIKFMQGDCIGENNTSDNIGVEEDTLRSKLESLEKYGILESEKKTYGSGGKIVYRLSENILDSFMKEELIDICILLEYIKNVSAIRVPYSFLQDKILLYLKVKYQIYDLKRDYFWFKQNHIYNIIDNEILYELLQNIKGNMFVAITTQGNNESKIEMYPGKIIYDVLSGRQYVVGMSKDKQENTPIVIRLDYIKSIDIKIEELRDISEIKNRDLICEKMNSAWCASDQIKEPTLVRIEFYIQQNEKFVLDRIKKEVGIENYQLIEKEEGVYHLSLEVLDPREMLPWIRSFGHRAKILESGKFELEIKLLKEWKEALNLYEIIS